MEQTLEHLLEENLKQVWGERDEILRMNAIESLYAKESTMYEVGEMAIGYDAINNAIGHVLNTLPPIFVFTKLKPIIINNNAGRLVWGVGPEGQPPVVTGMDVVIFENDKIKSVYVFLDK
jgi:hypothetical protein